MLQILYLQLIALTENGSVVGAFLKIWASKFSMEGLGEERDNYSLSQRQRQIEISFPPHTPSGPRGMGGSQGPGSTSALISGDIARESLTGRKGTGNNLLTNTVGKVSVSL